MAIALGYLVLLAAVVWLTGRALRNDRADWPGTPLVLPGDPALVQTATKPVSGVTSGWERAAGYALTLASVSALSVTALSTGPAAQADLRSAGAQPAPLQDSALRGQAPLAWLALEAGFNFDRLGMSPSEAQPDPFALSPAARVEGPQVAWTLDSDHEAVPSAWLMARGEDLWV